MFFSPIYWLPSNLSCSAPEQQARLARLRGDLPRAIAVFEHALEASASLKQAQTVLQFELSWCFISSADWANAANNFLKLRTLSAWSVSATIYFLSFPSHLLSHFVSVAQV
jgi:hypothetical protein